MKSTDSTTRRDFIKLTAMATAAASATSISAVAAKPAPVPKTIGIQVGSISFVDEGTEPVLDILQQRGAVNTIFLTTFTYGRGLAGRQIPRQPFPDHVPHAFGA